ncbi:MAG: toll/interleukin-1 receptor domain-containing protein, partial [Planctomycetota bacterium]
LLAANHEECGYAWAIPPGLQLRAEALLLQAAQQLGRSTLASEPTAPAAGSAFDADEPRPDASAFGSHEIPANVTALLEQAKQLLHEALDRWYDLRDPEPTEDNNFKLDGKEYNYRAAETHQVLVQLADGVLTSYPLVPIREADDEQKEGEPMSSTTRDQVFISYSHKDKKWLNQLLTHLKPHARDGSVSNWSDQQIKPGSKWFDEIKAALTRAKVAVLLVSPDFLASEFIREHELTPLLSDAVSGGVTILWIPVRSSAYQTSPLKDYHALSEPSEPIYNLRGKRDETWVKICEKISDALNAPVDPSQQAAPSAAGQVTPAQASETTAEFKERMLKADPLPVLDDRELALLEAIIPPLSMSDLQRANRYGEDVPAVNERKKLTQIKKFNRNLRKP